MDTLTIPASPKAVRAWLAPIASHHGAAGWQADILAKIIAVQCRDLPADIFDDAAQEDCKRDHDVFPTSLRLREWLYARAHGPIETAKLPLNNSRVREDRSRCASDIPTCEPITKPVRERSERHLAFVRKQTCCLCRRPADHAHHLTHAMPGLKARGLKVSDVFTVPVCARDHEAIHARGDEEAFWAERGFDPIALAQSLWRQSHGLPA